jgi:hypothetical protein
MVEENKSEKISLQQLMVSTLAMTDALAKSMIAKGIARFEHTAQDHATLYLSKLFKI